MALSIPVEDALGQLTIIPNDISRHLRDIYHTCFLLRQKLVPDVVPIIIHHAGLFRRSTSSTGQVKRPLVVDEDTAPRTCFIAPPIRTPVKTQYPVRRIAFLIQSCDQGWTDNPHGGSWTWFTAGVVADSNGDDPSDRSPDKEVKNKDRFLLRERQIYRNEVACSAFKTHVVEWTVDSADDEEREWVTSLQRGDRVAVRAWAQHAGWENQVRSVSVAVYAAAVV